MIVVRCQKCNKEFSVRPSASKFGRGKYCSRWCQYNRPWKCKEGERYCWSCKKVFPQTDEFFYKNKSKKGGWCDECKLCKKKYSYKDFLKRAKLRKEFIKSCGSKCSKCGEYEEDSSFFDIDHVIPVAVTKTPRFLPLKYDGLQVLCPNCHRRKSIDENRKRKLWRTKDSDI